MDMGMEENNKYLAYSVIVEGREGGRECKGKRETENEGGGEKDGEGERGRKEVAAQRDVV